MTHIEKRRRISSLRQRTAQRAPAPGNCCRRAEPRRESRRDETRARERASSHLRARRAKSCRAPSTRRSRPRSRRGAACFLFFCAKKYKSPFFDTTLSPAMTYDSVNWTAYIGTAHVRERKLGSGVTEYTFFPPLPAIICDPNTTLDDQTGAATATVEPDGGPHKRKRQTQVRKVGDESSGKRTRKTVNPRPSPPYPPRAARPSTSAKSAAGGGASTDL